MANVASSTVVGGGSDNSVVADVDSVSVDVDPVVTEVDPVLAQVTEADSELTEVDPVVTDVDPVLTEVAEADSELTEVDPVVAEVDSNGPVVAGSHRGHAAELTQTEPTAKRPPAIRGRAFWDQRPSSAPNQNCYLPPPAVPSQAPVDFPVPDYYQVNGRGPWQYDPCVRCAQCGGVEFFVVESDSALQCVLCGKWD